MCSSADNPDPNITNDLTDTPPEASVDNKVFEIVDKGGDTLLAIQAPSGTQLEVPIPEMGQNGQKKYQINLKSHSGPIHVLLINKESSSSKPVVFPVPPPDDLTQPSSQSSTSETPQKSTMAAQNLPEQQVSERSQSYQQTPATEISSGPISGDIIDELMSSDGLRWYLGARPHTRSVAPSTVEPSALVSAAFDRVVVDCVTRGEPGRKD
ncbi:hypothetical protein STEG23_012176 [Scotinomys teguina]